MSRMVGTRYPVCVLALLFLLNLPACVVVGGSHYEEVGVPIGSASLAQVAIGKTTEVWITAVFGESTAREPSVHHPGSVELVYESYVIDRRGSLLLMLLGNASNDSSTCRVVFEITEGVVTGHTVETIADVPDHVLEEAGLDDEEDGS